MCTWSSALAAVVPRAHCPVAVVVPNALLSLYLPHAPIKVGGDFAASAVHTEGGLVKRVGVHTVEEDEDKKAGDQEHAGPGFVELDTSPPGSRWYQLHDSGLERVTTLAALHKASTVVGVRLSSASPVRYRSALAPGHCAPHDPFAFCLGSRCPECLLASP